MSTIISVQSVRDYLQLASPGSNSQYSDGTIGSNIRAATSYLEQATHRILAQQTGVTYRTTSMGRAIVPIPGFSTLTSVVYQGATQTIGYDVNSSGASCWAITDPLMTGVYVAIQFRAYRADGFGMGVPGTPYGPWIANSNWYDQAADSPFYPANLGGGYFYGSMPNDVIVTGNAGYATGSEPESVLHAVKVLASFYTMRPASILADTAITPQGGVLTYSQLPSEVRQFIADWTIGQQVVSVGG